MMHTVYATTFVPKEIEIPDACPDCGADFHKPRALVESNWQDCTIESHIERQNALDPALHLEPEGETDYGETYYPSGVACRNCDWQLDAAASPEPAL